MKQQWVLRGAVAAILTTAATINLAHAVVVRNAPPPPPHEGAMAIERAPRPGMVWTPGYYRWRAGTYFWMPGRWVVPPRAGAVWVPPMWRRGPHGYAFVGGRWR
jgi:hypothetical protein